MLIKINTNITTESTRNNNSTSVVISQIIHLENGWIMRLIPTDRERLVGATIK